MATFKQSHLTSSDDVLARQKGKPVIFLEGETDHRIFSEYWFVDQLDQIEFKLAENGQGCSSVLKAVANERRGGVAAFGLVDRDKLMAESDLTLLLEPDDAKFEAAQPYPHIKVALRWELENYLIDPAILEANIAALERSGKKQGVAAMTAELLNHAEVLIPFTAWNLALHRCNKNAQADGRSNPIADRLAMQVQILKDLDDTPDVLHEFNEILPRIDAFSGAAELPEAQKLTALLRIVNGKAMLLRIKHRMKSKIDLTFLLAKDLGNSVPAEFCDFVSQCTQTE